MLSGEKKVKTLLAHLCLTRTHFVGVVVTVFWTSNRTKESRISVNILSKE